MVNDTPTLSVDGVVDHVGQGGKQQRAFFRRDAHTEHPCLNHHQYFIDGSDYLDSILYVHFASRTLLLSTPHRRRLKPVLPTFDRTVNKMRHNAPPTPRRARAVRVYIDERPVFAGLWTC